jgi:hypothetical protein
MSTPLSQAILLEFVLAHGPGGGLMTSPGPISLPVDLCKRFNINFGTVMAKGDNSGNKMSNSGIVL